MNQIHFFTEQTNFTIKNKTKIREWITHIVCTSWVSSPKLPSRFDSAQRPCGMVAERSRSHRHHEIGEINIIFSNDEYLLKLNEQYLGHDTFTDIITFETHAFPELVEGKGGFDKLNHRFTDDKIISGDIFISVDRMKENAKLFHVAQSTEMHRLIVHGVLHLLGYKDDTPKNKKIMVTQEETALTWWNNR